MNSLYQMPEGWIIAKQRNACYWHNISVQLLKATELGMGDMDRQIIIVAQEKSHMYSRMAMRNLGECNVQA